MKNPAGAHRNESKVIANYLVYLSCAIKWLGSLLHWPANFDYPLRPSFAE
jgi:hypothetical protein